MRFYLLVLIAIFACSRVGTRLPDGFPKDLLIKTLRIEDQGALPGVENQVLLMMVPDELFDQYEWNLDKERLLAYYRSRGFVNATIDSAEVVRGEDGIELAFVVDPGEGLVLNRISIRSSGAISASRLAEFLGTDTGDRMDQYTLEHGKSRIRAELASLGFVHADVEAHVTIEGSRAFLSLYVDEGARAYVGKVELAGLKGVRESIASKYVTLKSDRLFRPNDVQNTQRYLLSTGLFNSVRILVPGMDRHDDTLNVFLKVREAPNRFVESGFGYAYPQSFTSTVAVGHQNLWGMAASLELELELERGWVGDRWQRTERVQLDYTEPWFRFLPFAAGATVDYKRKAESGSSYQSIGASFQVGRSWFDKASAFLRYKYRFRETEITGADTTDFLLEEIERPITNSVEGTVTLDTRDSFADPVEGHLVRLQALHAGGFLGGDWAFRKVFADWSVYGEFGPTVLAFRVRGGAIHPLSGSPTAPEEERFRAGGANTVRGFGEEQLGPKDQDGDPLGGEGLCLANAEVRIPVKKPLTIGVFLDCGQVWEKASHAKVSDLEPSAGFGMRYGTIIGPVRIDWGVPLLKGRKGRVYLTLGHAF